MIRRIAVLIAGSAFMAGDGVAQGGDGYLLKQPTATIKFESGYGFQAASSEVFTFVRQEHTIGERDFDSPYFGAELGFRVNEHFDVALSAGYQSASVLSEFRRFVDQDNLPINQVTELRQIPMAVGLKYYPFARGRSLGRFAWVPRTVSPFLGAGIGMVASTFEQTGDFIDFLTDDIFYDQYTSEQNAFLTRLSAGVNVSIANAFLFSLEGRYGWSQSPMNGGDFVDFDPIDLDGLQLIGGLAFRF